MALGYTEPDFIIQSYTYTMHYVCPEDCPTVPHSPHFADFSLPSADFIVPLSQKTQLSSSTWLISIFIYYE